MIDLNCDMRFMSNNFLSTGYSALNVSSADNNSSVSLFTDGKRSKTFKFAGRFLIEYGVNDRIYINYLSVNYSLLIPAREYDRDGLVGMVNFLLSSTAPDIGFFWSSSQSKFFFYCNNTFTLLSSNKASSAWETLGIYDTDDIVSSYNSSGLRYEAFADVTRFHWPCEFVQVDFGYQAAIGFIGIIGKSGEEIKIPKGARVRFMANNVNNFSLPLVDIDLTWSKDVIYSFLDNQSDSSFRYVKLEIYSPEGPFDSEIGQLYIGDYSRFVNRNISTGIRFGYRDFSSQSSAENGQIYSNEKSPLRVIQGLKVGLARPENITFLKNLFLLKQKNIPFFVALDPKAHITSSVDELLIYCRFSQEPQNDHIIYRFYEMSFELTEAL